MSRSGLQYVRMQELYMKALQLFFTAAIAIFFGILSFHCAEDSKLFSHQRGLWEIAPYKNQNRWIIIHNLDKARDEGIFHIEIIAREKGKKVWEILRIRKHMAITIDALERSVKRPIGTGDVYPESFLDAYSQWKKNAAQGIKTICTTSVDECLRNGSK